MRFRETALMAALLCNSSFAQLVALKEASRHIRVPTDAAMFDSCGQVEALARQGYPGTAERVYTVEVFPKGQPRPMLPFMSDSPLSQITNWIKKDRELGRSPAAILYFIDGRYAFRCRNSRGLVEESTGPNGDPLSLDLPSGRAEILHFDLSNNGFMAHAYVVTAMSLEQIDGDRILAEVKKRLGAGSVFLYIRNDPWFYGQSIDSTPYVFADTDDAPTVEEYKASQTIVCGEFRATCGVVKWEGP